MNAILADPDSLFHALAGLVLLSALGVVVYVSAKAGVALFVALVALSTDLRDPVLAPGITTAGIEVGVLDVLAAVMLLSAVARVSTGYARGRHVVWIGVLVGLLSLNIVRGIADYGLQITVNEARSWIYFLAALAFCGTAPIRDVRWWTRLAFCYGLWLIFWITAGLAATGLNPVTSYVEIDGRLTDPRPVTAAAAAVLAQILLLIAARTSRRRDVVVVLLLAGVVVVLQHRTVWFAALGGAAYLGFRKLRDGGRGRLAVVVGGGGLAAVSVVALLTGVIQRSAVAVSASNITASDNTFIWRVTGWRELLHEHITLTTALVGKPFGSGFRRLIGGRVVEVSAHSHYVETFLRFGLVGLLASILLFVLAWRTAQAAGPSASAFRSTLIVLAVFGISYRCGPVQGILLGTVLGAAATGLRPVRPESADRPGVPAAAG